jgi:hypothetical protein
MAIEVSLITKYPPAVRAIAPDLSPKPPPGCRRVGWLFVCSVLAEKFDGSGVD